MSETVIKVENLTKFYQLGLINHGTLAKDLQGWWAKLRGRDDPNSRISMVSKKSSGSDTDFIYALKDVSFDVQQGEVLGIIGANGAGKSTLLKILSRVTSPTSGCIKIKGRIGSLLEVGTGFHPELTGRENIYLNGAILGMRRWEIDKKLDEIIDFSGVEKFIDTPVKRYSSGMYVRLAFAVAAHLDPEILVVDEVLAVGDADFQKKCLGKMGDVSKKEGRTVLFVSHNMKSIRQLCNTGILLENGKLICSGKCSAVVDKYLSLYRNSDALNGNATFEPDEAKTHQFLEAKLVDADGMIISNPIDVDDDFYLCLKYRARKKVNAHLAFYFSNLQEDIVWYNERTDYYREYVNLETGTYYSRIKIPNPFLKPGKYFLTIGFMDRNQQVNDLKKDVLSLEISDKKVFRIGERAGNIYFPVEWNIDKIS